MELIAYIGPMWAGKTSLLKHFILTAKSNGLRVGIFENPNNHRNSYRDLIRMFAYAKVFTPDSVLNPERDVLVFDEIHLYDCFGGADLFLQTLKKATAKVVVMAGIYYDFYNDYRIFPIWNKLSHMGCEFRDVVPVQPCHICGSYIGVRYTVSIGKPTERVGDMYRNVCRDCSIKYLREWKAKNALVTA